MIKLSKINKRQSKHYVKLLSNLYPQIQLIGILDVKKEGPREGLE